MALKDTFRVIHVLFHVFSDQIQTFEVHWKTNAPKLFTSVRLIFYFGLFQCWVY